MIQFLKTAALAVGLTYKITLTTLMLIGLAKSMKESQNRDPDRKKELDETEP